VFSPSSLLIIIIIIIVITFISLLVLVLSFYCRYFYEHVYIDFVCDSNKMNIFEVNGGVYNSGIKLNAEWH